MDLESLFSSPKQVNTIRREGKTKSRPGSRFYRRSRKTGNTKHFPWLRVGPPLSRGTGRGGGGGEGAPTTIETLID